MARKKSKPEAEVADVEETGAALLEAVNAHINALIASGVTPAPADDDDAGDDDDDDDAGDDDDDDEKPAKRKRGKKKADSDEVDFDELTKRFTKYVKTEGKAAAKKLLGSKPFKVGALSELEEDQYAEFMEAMDE